VPQEFSRVYPQVAINVFELRPKQIQEGLADGSIDFGFVSRIGLPADICFYREALYTIATTLEGLTGHTLHSTRSLHVLTQAARLSCDVLDDSTSLIDRLLGRR
jgi:hypothetical protein